MPYSNRMDDKSSVICHGRLLTIEEASETLDGIPGTISTGYKQ